MSIEEIPLEETHQILTDSLLSYCNQLIATNPIVPEPTFPSGTAFFYESWIPLAQCQPQCRSIAWPSSNQSTLSLLSSITDAHLSLATTISNRAQSHLSLYTDRLKQIISEAEQIQSVKKQNVFSASVTDAEAEIISKRISLQQQQHAEYDKVEMERKFLTLLETFPYYSREEIIYALQVLKESVEDALVKFAHLDYLYRLRKSIAGKGKRLNVDEDYVAADEEEDDDDDEEDEDDEDDYGRKRKRRVSRYSHGREGYRSPRIYKCTGRLRLDEALAKLDESSENPEDAMRGWSSARIRAYKCIKENPNAYYYRFNAPGECQANGPWTESERKMFLNRLAVCGADGNWGIFAMKIPGRVGYQCSNFYRKLLDEGVVTDDNYYQDGDGKWHFRFSTSNAKGRSRNGKKRNLAIVDDNEEEEKEKDTASECNEPTMEKGKSVGEKRTEYVVKGKGKKAAVKRAKASPEISTSPAVNFADNLTRSEPVGDGDVLNPLPGFIDPITLEPVKRPAISPYGHVMGYESWVRCLSQQSGDLKNTCPLTKRPLKKRELVLLTVDNIDEYKDKIVM